MKTKKTFPAQVKKLAPKAAKKSNVNPTVVKLREENERLKKLCDARTGKTNQPESTVSITHSLTDRLNETKAYIQSAHDHIKSFLTELDEYIDKTL